MQHQCSLGTCPDLTKCSQLIIYSFTECIYHTTHSSTHSWSAYIIQHIHPLIHGVHTSYNAFIHLFIENIHHRMHSFIHSFTHSQRTYIIEHIHSFTENIHQERIHSFIHSFIHSHIHSSSVCPTKKGVKSIHASIH